MTSTVTLPATVNPELETRRRDRRGLALAIVLCAQLMIVLVRTRMRCVEIPVHYRKRVGISKITGSFWNALKLGCKMIFMILGYRFWRFPQLQSSISQDMLADIGEQSDNWRNDAHMHGRKDLKPLKYP